jgi:hypothetical protein
LASLSDVVAEGSMESNASAELAEEEVISTSYERWQQKWNGRVGTKNHSIRFETFDAEFP